MKKLKIVLLFSFILIILLRLNINYSYANEKNIEGIINAYKIEDNKLSLEVLGKEKIIVNYYFKNDQEVKKYKIELGQKIKATGEMKLPNTNRNFNLFNYKDYLKSKKIYHIFKADKIILKKNNQIKYKIKNKIINQINKSKNKKYLNLFILGENNLDLSVKTSFKENGISHLFAISGMHITLFTSFILSILNKISKNKIFHFIIVTIFLLVYMFLTNYTPSVVRASLFFIVLNIKKIFNLKVTNLELIIFLLLILLIYNPYYIYNSGFIYSFLISICLIYFNKNSNNYFKSLFITSIIAFLVSMPITTNLNYEINLFSPILNLFFVPFVSFIVFPLSLLNFMIIGIDPLLGILINFLEKVSLLCSNIKILNIILCSIPIYIVVLYYIVIFLVIKKAQKRYIILLIILIIIHSNINCLNKYPIITMIDIGQGDSILIELPHNKGNILIDTGGETSFDDKKNKYSIAKNTIIPYLKSRGIKKLDYLILSHGDFDHLGEAFDLINNFKIKKVIFNSGKSNINEKNIKKLLKDKNIPYKEVNTYNLKIDTYEFKFINKKNEENENEDSLVIYTTLNNKKLLFMGDAGIDTEKYLLDTYNLKKIDILKVGHHGSKYSSDLKFLKAIKPKISLISAGINNKFNHPHEETLEKLKKLHSKIYLTSSNGMIQIILKKNLDIKTVF